MAVEIYCDWCGERVRRYASIESYDRTSRGRITFHYCTDGGEESCYRQTLDLLRQRAAWAHRGEGSELVWRLVDAAGVKTDPAGGCPVGDEWRRRADAGTPLYTLDLCAKAEDGLREANLVTLEEVAGRSEAEVSMIDGVGPKSLRLLRGELDRRGLGFRDDREAVS